MKALTTRISERLSIPRPRRITAASRGPGMLKSVPYRGGVDDIDLDKTIDVLTEKPAPEDHDIIVRERVHPRRAVLLAVDVSGSMRGERVKTAAAAVGALAGELADDNVGVLAFWSDAAWLVRPGHKRAGLCRLVDDLLRLPAKGLTNLAFPLELAGRELGSRAQGGCARRPPQRLRPQRRSGSPRARAGHPAPGRPDRRLGRERHRARPRARSLRPRPRVRDPRPPRRCPVADGRVRPLKGLHD